MKSFTAPELIKEYYLQYNSLSRDDLVQKAALAEQERQALLNFNQNYELKYLSANWKSIFLVCASIEANTSSYFKIDDFTVYGPHYFDQFVECMGVPYGDIGQRWMDLAYDRQDIPTWGRFFALADDCEKMFGVKVSEEKLIDLYHRGRELGGRDHPNVSRTMRRYKHYPYPVGWWSFFVELWEIISADNNFDRPNSEILNLRIDSSQFKHGSSFRFNVIKCADLENKIDKNAIFTVDGISFINFCEAINIAQECLLKLECYEVNKIELVKSYIKMKTLLTMAHTEFDFLNFYEKAIRLHAQEEFTLDRFATEFFQLNPINL
jgi:hypothetical protein